MKNHNIIIGFLLINFAINSTFSYKTKKNPNGLSEYLQVIKSEWGSKCINCKEFNNSYKVYFVNTCNDTLDIKVSMQNKNKTWKILREKILSQMIQL